MAIILRNAVWLATFLKLLATVKAAPPIQGRKLDDGTAVADYFEYDLSQFSLRFEQCQYIKMYDDELAEDNNYDSPLATRHFVVFRLCPSDSCDTCEVYGTYTLGVQDYLQFTSEYQKQDLEAMCESCDESCDGDVDNCSGCGKTCYLFENLEDSGYIDASQYVECQVFEVQNNDDANAAAGDDGANNNALYIGPRCDSGSSIVIGLFSDENCAVPLDDMDVEEVLGAKLSYHLLQHTSSNNSPVCLSCAEGVYAEDDDKDAADEDNVNEMCEELYNSAAKCETETGITNGFIQSNRDEQDYENQVENEFMACTFIQSLIWKSYTEEGEINFQAQQDVIVRQVTHTQKVSFGLLSAFFAVLLGLLLYYHLKIAQFSQPGLVSTGGSFA